MAVLVAFLEESGAVEGPRLPSAFPVRLTASVRTRPGYPTGASRRSARVRECPAWCTCRRSHRQEVGQAAGWACPSPQTGL
jgi:hypothetical protein